MKATIDNRPVFTTLTVTLDGDEAFRAEGGAMVSMSPNVQLASKKQGKGIGGLLKAAVSGEGIFASEFRAEGGPGEVVLAPPTPGDILEFNLDGRTIYAQNGSYLAGAADLELGTKGSLKAMISGEGLFLQTISGHGPLYLSCYGSVFSRTLGAGESYVVDTGHLLAFEEGVEYRVKTVSKGLFSTIASGEGLVAEFSGPGTIWIQSRNLSGFAALLSRLLPDKK
jgi:uncharacterized protein (TIGR00266 family)